MADYDKSHAQFEFTRRIKFKVNIAQRIAIYKFYSKVVAIYFARSDILYASKLT